jgi:hypothetical protein
MVRDVRLCDYWLSKLHIFSKQIVKTHGDKQLAQKWVGSRDHCTSRVCSRLVDGVAQGCNIRSPVALAERVDADYALSVTIT